MPTHGGNPVSFENCVLLPPRPEPRRGTRRRAAPDRPLGQALLQHLQQNLAGGRGTIKCPKPTPQRPPGGQALPYVAPSACLPALASVLGRSPGKQSTGLFAIPAHPPRPRAFAASPAEPRRGTLIHKVPKTTIAAHTRRSGIAHRPHYPQAPASPTKQESQHLQHVHPIQNP